MSVDKLVTDILGEQPTVKDRALRELIDARMKKGGEVKMGKGGAIKSLVKAIAKELPEAKASQKTQIPGTEPTYRKAYDILEREKPGGRTLDYGAGLGHGSRLMGAESFEPFPREGFKPDFIRPEDIPTEEFDRLVNLNVLNVMPREMRDATVENIGRVMRPGGMGIVTTRGRDVLNAAGEAGPEPMSKITSIGTYQKGFSPEELREYLKYMLGEGYDISRLNLGPAGALVRKKGKAEGGEIKKADGGAIGKNVGRGMAGLRRSREPLDPKEIQAMMLDVPAGVGIPFAEAGAEYLRGNVEDAETSAAIDAALTAVPVVGALAKPAYRAVKSGVKKAAPAVREAASGALESAMESGLIQGPSYAVKPTGGQWLGKGNVLDVTRRDDATGPAAIQKRREIADASRQAYEEDPTDVNRRLMETSEAMAQSYERAGAVNNWIDANLQNYVRKQMGTPDDPVLKLAEQGILHMPYQETSVLRGLAEQREKAGFPAEGLATTGLGRMWETMTDRSIASIEAGKLTDPNYLKDLERRARENDPLFNARPGRVNDDPSTDVMTPAEARDLQRFKYMNYPPARANVMEENQWLSRVDPETPIYSLSNPFGGSMTEQDLGFDHVIDVLRADLAAGRIRPEQLSKMSMEQAVRRTHEYDLERAAAMAKAAEEETANLSVAKEFDDGFRVVQLDKPGQFAKESDRMGHSVRGYEPSRDSEDWIEGAGDEGSDYYGHGGWGAIKSGDAQVFSIRDAKNNPHVTIEVAGPKYPGDNPVSAFNNLGKPFREAQQEAAERIGLPEAKFPPDMSVEQRTEMQAKFEQAMQDIFAEHGGKLQRRITQIKGKQNRKPDEKYLPYVQQFIREGNYEITGDLKNTGLIDTKQSFAYQNVPDNLWKVQENLPQDAPRYITEAELERFARTGKFEPDFKKGGAVQGYAKGGAIKSLIKKASEALGEHEGKSLLVTQSDRTKVGGKFLGGPGFSSLQLTDPFYKEAEAVWGVGKKGAATKMINAAQRLPEGKAIWSTMIGSPEQHKSNQQVFDELLRKFRSSAKEGNLDPDLRERINAKLASAVDGEGKPLFPEGVDIMSPKFRQIANTFDRRAIAADAMGGVQLGGKKGQIIDYSKIIESTTDPLLIDQPTHAIGPRLFQLQGDVIERPDLHPAYPFILTGEDLATEFVPVPRDIMLRDFVEGIRQSKGREPGFMDLTRNTPSQFLSEEFLTGLQKSGFKKGGPVKKGALPTKRA